MMDRHYKVTIIVIALDHYIIIHQVAITQLHRIITPRREDIKIINKAFIITINTAIIKHYTLLTLMVGPIMVYINVNKN